MLDGGVIVVLVGVAYAAATWVLGRAVANGAAGSPREVDSSASAFLSELAAVVPASVTVCAPANRIVLVSKDLAGGMICLAKRTDRREVDRFSRRQMIGLG